MTARYAIGESRGKKRVLSRNGSRPSINLLLLFLERKFHQNPKLPLTGIYSAWNQLRRFESRMRKVSCIVVNSEGLGDLFTCPMIRACTSHLLLGWSQKIVLAEQAVAGPQSRGRRIPPTWFRMLLVLRLELRVENRSRSRIATRDDSAPLREDLQPGKCVSFRISHKK
jgi:hypothetical protein